MKLECCEKYVLNKSLFSGVKLLYKFSTCACYCLYISVFTRVFVCAMLTWNVWTFTLKLPDRVSSSGEAFPLFWHINKCSVSERLSWKQHEENVCHVTMVIDSMKLVSC